MVLPATAGELSQYIYCLQWMSYSIPDFATRIAPLRDILEAAYKQSGKRTRRSIDNIPLSKLSWGQQHETSFNSLQDSLREAVKLNHPDPEKETCVYTDASDTHWAAVVTQRNKEDLSKPIENQWHEPLAFLSSAFKNSEIHWSTFEKEARNWTTFYSVKRQLTSTLITGTCYLYSTLCLWRHQSADML